MSSRSPNDDKAVKWFFEQNPDFKVTMGLPGWIYYYDGKAIQKRTVASIRHSWENNKKKNKDNYA